MSVSFWQTSQDQEKNFKQFDIVIIGGGVAGLSTAYWLEKNNSDLSICLLEKYQIGAGASGRNAGFITCGSVEHFNRLVGKHGKQKALEIWDFSKNNLEYLEDEIFSKTSNDLGYNRSGSFSLASTASEFEELQASAQLMQEMNINVEVASEDSIKERLGVENFVGGVKYIDDGSVHPMKLLKEIQSKLKRTVIFENAEVYDVQEKGTNKVYSSKVNIESEIVIYATNAYSKQLDHYFEDKIFPTRGQILSTQAVPLFMESPCYANFVLDYFRQLPSGELLIGGFRQLQKDAEIGYSDEISDVIQNALHDFILKYIPRLKDVPITHRWSGIMGFSVDGDPIIGALPRSGSHFFLGGFTAHGLGLAFNSAKCLSEEILGINTTSSIPDIVSARRFS